MEAEENKKVLVIENDLFFSSKITATLKQIGLRSVLATQLAEINKFLKEQDVILVILDLSVDGMDTVTFVHKLKSSQSTCSIPVIAFAEHSERELLQGAREAGCEIVVSNRGLVEDLKDLVEASLA